MMASRSGARRNWPWLTLFVVLPAVATVALRSAKFAPNVSGGLLGGIGVLGGLLFGVNAWVASRVASLADTMGERAATPYELALLRRLDIARANIAYASFVSITFVTALGLVSMFLKTPRWINLASIFVLLHLGMTLVLVVLRINQIGKNDRIAARTAHARKDLTNTR